MISYSDTHFDEQKRIWSGPKKKDFYGPDMTLGEAALFMLSRNPESVVQITDTTGEKLTASQLIRNSKSIACALLRMGFQPGDVMGISSDNVTHLSAAIIAGFLCGMPINAVYPDFDEENVAMVFKVTTPKIIFCEVKNYNILKSVVENFLPESKVFLIDGEIEGVHNVSELLNNESYSMEKNLSFPCSELSGDDTAVILCSSGTTGTPKGALCSHRALLNQHIYPGIQSHDVIFTFSTMYWASGLWSLTNAILYGIKRIITNKPFTPDYFLELIEKYQISHVISGPFHIAQVIQNATPETTKRLASIKMLICGGSKIPQVMDEKMNAILGSHPNKDGFVVAYGMSELSSMLSENDGGVTKRRLGSEGKLMPNTEVRIISENGEQLNVNEPGIIYIRTPYPWRGYYRNKDATAKALINGWLVTGDIGYFDENGYLHICSRSNDVFKSNGFQICPERIEEVIMQLPGVLETGVFGVPDFVASNLTACAVVRTDNIHGERLTADDIIEHVAQKMSAFYHIKAGVFFMKALPKTGSGKVQRRKILETLNLRC